MLLPFGIDLMFVLLIVCGFDVVECDWLSLWYG